MPIQRDETKLYYVHDPMCSWCWGFRPMLDLLIQALPEDIALQRLLGGLAPDTDEPMPTAMRTQLEATWRRIQETVPGTPFNFEFWRRVTPQRSTWPACRAVIAARRLEPTLEPAMILAIQQAYYLEAQNPSDKAVLIDLAERIGLPRPGFAALLNADDTADRLADEIAAARAMGADHFPSLRLAVDGRISSVPLNYRDPTPMLDAIAKPLGL